MLFSDPSNSLEIELQVFLSSTWKSLEVINYSADAHSREFLTRAKKLKQRNKKSELASSFKKKGKSSESFRASLMPAAAAKGSFEIKALLCSQTSNSLSLKNKKLSNVEQTSVFQVRIRTINSRICYQLK